MFFRGFPAGTENFTVESLNLKEFSNDITAPFKRRWQAGDKRSINAGCVEENRACPRAAGLDKQRSKKRASRKCKHSSRNFGKPFLSLSQAALRKQPSPDS
jgi:hypothetical protein